METKICKKCKLSKSLDSFHKCSTDRSGVQPKCKECQRQWSIEYYRDHPGLREERRIKNMYGLSIDQYNEMMSQGCAICGTMENLQIDHDHRCCPRTNRKTCGKCVRGVLCGSHNKAEGHFKNIDEITALLAYRMQFEEVDGIIEKTEYFEAGVLVDTKIGGN